MRKITRKALALLAVLCLLLSISGAIVFADDPVTVNSGETMTVNENLEANITVKEDATLNITDEVTVTGNVINSGETNNNGEIDGRVANRDSGIVINNGDIEAPAAVANSGNFTNTSDGTIEGTIQNINDGTFTNNGTITPYESENGTATSPISNQGIFTNTEDGNITSNIINTGTVINNGTISAPITTITITDSNNNEYEATNASATIINHDTCNNTESGIINGRISNTENGTFINDGTIVAQQLHNVRIDQDNDNVTESDRTTKITNTGTFTNNEGAAIESSFNNNGGVFTNNGTLTGDIITCSDGKVINNGDIKDASGVEETGQGIIENNGLIETMHVSNRDEATLINNGTITIIEKQVPIAETTEIETKSGIIQNVSVIQNQENGTINGNILNTQQTVASEDESTTNITGDFINNGTINGNVSNRDGANFENNYQINAELIYNNGGSTFENNGKIAATTEVVNGLANSQDDVFIDHRTITLDAETFTEM